MKKTNYIFLALVALLTVTSADILKKGGRTDNAGSPGEQTCRQCHSTFPLNDLSGSVLLESDIPVTGYVPGTTYNVSVIVERDGMSIFGLGLEALNAANANAGTFIITDPTATQLLTGANGRKNVTHKLNGGLSPNSKAFDCQWTAPAAGTGTVTFYTSAIAGNGNNNDSGDYTFATTLTANENTVSISPAFDTQAIEAFPNPSQEWVYVSVKNPHIKQLNLMDISGKAVISMVAQEKTGMYIAPLARGMYFLQALDKSGNILSSQKIVKK